MREEIESAEIISARTAWGRHSIVTEEIFI